MATEINQECTETSPVRHLRPGKREAKKPLVRINDEQEFELRAGLVRKARLRRAEED